MNSASEANELSELSHFLRLFQSGSALQGISSSRKLTCIDEYVPGSVSSPVGSPHVTPSKQQSSASHSNVESAGMYTPGNVYHPSGTNASGARLPSFEYEYLRVRIQTIWHQRLQTCVRNGWLPNGKEVFP